ncbi:MAG: sulfatase [Acidobacteriota bacterium]
MLISTVLQIGRCAPEIRPNVILISLDTVRADHLSVYGYNRATTPNLHRLAREGVVFDQAFTQAPWTVSAHMSVFTSLYPEAHKVSHLTPQSETVKTLPELLRAAGYSTGGFVAPILRGYGFAKGFQHYFTPSRARPAELMIDRALKWLARDPADPVLQEEPFFLFLHLFDAHYPYEPPWPFDTAYVSSYSPDIREISGSHPYWQEKNLTADELFQTVALYDGEIRYMDHALGRFFERLQELSVYDSSLILVMSDHGEGFLEHGLMNHGNSVYEELIRVPLIVRFPGGTFKGQRVGSPVQLINIAPTILEFVGAEPLEMSQGFSLMGPIGSKSHRPRLVHAVEGYADCVRTSSWKLIQNPSARFTKIPRSLKVKYELYDLEKDAGEQKNLASNLPDRVHSMAKALQRLKKSNLELRMRIHDSLKAYPIELTEEQERNLRSLGYIQ